MKSAQYFQILVHSALVDGVLKQEEIEVLRDFSRRLKLSDESAAKIFENAKQGLGLPFELPTKPKEAKMLFRHVARVVVADKQLADEESNLVLSVGHRLGMSTQAIYAIIDEEMAKLTETQEPELALLPLDDDPRQQPRERPKSQQAKRSSPQPKTEYRSKAPKATGVEGRAAGMDDNPFDSKTLISLSRNMYIVSLLFWIIPGALSLISAVGTLVNIGRFPFWLIALQLCICLTSGCFLLVVGVKTVFAGQAFREAVRSRKMPVKPLKNAINALASVYFFQLIGIVLSILLAIASVAAIIGGGMFMANELHNNMQKNHKKTHITFHRQAKPKRE